MKIGLIGTGAIGSTLTRQLTKLGHTVEISNSRGPSSLTELAQETGATPVTVADVVKGKDIIIVTIPEKAVPDLPKDLFKDVPASTVVIDTGNYYPFRDGNIEELDEKKLTESEWVAKHIGHTVIKVFNNIGFLSLRERAAPKGSSNRMGLPVAGDDAAAKAIALDLVDKIGFDPVDAGSLAESWRQEPGTPVYCTDYDAAGVKQTLSQADRSRSAAVSEESINVFMTLMKQGAKREQFIEGIRDVVKRHYYQH